MTDLKISRPAHGKKKRWKNSHIREGVVVCIGQKIASLCFCRRTGCAKFEILPLAHLFCRKPNILNQMLEIFQKYKISFYRFNMTSKKKIVNMKNHY